MAKTIDNPHIEQPVVGYMLNVPLSFENQQTIKSVQKQFTQKFGEAIWNTPAQSLHITLLDWIAPLVDYDGRNKEELFKEIYYDYDQLFGDLVSGQSPIKVSFNDLQVGQHAVFLQGYDNGEFADIRSRFLDKVSLLPGTKLPPKIVHTTIARFQQSIDLEPIQNFAQQIPVAFEQQIRSFRLVKETIDPMLEFQIIKEYSLQ